MRGRPKGSGARDLTGEQFERLTVISRADSRSYRSYWNVRCSCGVEKEVSQSVLVGRKARSCGCLQQEVRISANTKHGYNRTPTYVSWCAMVARCANPKLKSYKNYGGRGIAVCDRWLEFSNFLADMGERPPGKSIDRFPDNDGHYEPGNCRWATASEQRINQRPRAAAEIGKAME